MRRRRPNNGPLNECQNLLEIARLVGWCMNRNYLIKICLDHVSQRLEKRVRCVLTEEGDLKPYDGLTGQAPTSTERITLRVLEKGVTIKFTDTHEAEPAEVKIEGVIPLWYVDQLTQEEKKAGALIVETGKKRAPISPGDFDYLKAVGELIGAAVGKAELAEQMVEFYRKREAMVRETAHAFRNRITAIGGFSQRIARLAKDTSLAKEARVLHNEIQSLESHVERFEKYVDITNE